MKMYIFVLYLHIPTSIHYQSRDKAQTADVPDYLNQMHDIGHCSKSGLIMNVNIQLCIFKFKSRVLEVKP
jgi:hypothetical protein